VIYVIGAMDRPLQGMIDTRRPNRHFISAGHARDGEPEPSDKRLTCENGWDSGRPPEPCAQVESCGAPCTRCVKTPLPAQTLMRGLCVGAAYATGQPHVGDRGPSRPEASAASTTRA